MNSPFPMDAFTIVKLCICLIISHILVLLFVEFLLPRVSMILKKKTYVNNIRQNTATKGYIDKTSPATYRLWPEWSVSSSTWESLPHTCTPLRLYSWDSPGTVWSLSGQVSWRPSPRTCSGLHKQHCRRGWCVRHPGNQWRHVFMFLFCWKRTLE